MTSPSSATAQRHIVDSYLTERLQAEITFVRDLATLHPVEGAAWPSLADQAEKVWADALAAGKGTAETLGLAEAVLSPAANIARSYTIHCVGHAHIDMNWQWPWQETVETCIATTRSVLRLMRDYPAFCFSQSQASVYEILRSYAPELFAEIRERIREGRWEVTASHWVEGERNTAGAEAMVRQLVNTRAWMQEHLGLKPEDVVVDWVPDCFGHAATIPSIDARAGVRHYYHWRSGGIDRPPAFWWKAPDGSRLLVVRETSGSCQGYNGNVTVDMGKDILAFVRQTGGRDWMSVYGVGDHGGGPTRRNIARILDMDTWPIWPHCVFSTTRRFFKTLELLGDRLPTWDRELNTEYSGCLISQSAIKRTNRQVENALSDTDAANALVQSACGHPFPRDRMTGAWREALLTHFHDILPGSGVAATRHYTLGMAQRILAETTTIQSRALATLVANIDTSAVGAPNLKVAVPNQLPVNLGAGAGFTIGNTSAGQPVDGWPVAAVLHNPAPWTRHEVIALRVWEGHIPFTQSPRTRFGLRDHTGKIVAAQVLKKGRYWSHTFIDVAVPVEVAASGWSTYAVIEEVAANEPGQRVTLIQDQEGNRNHPPIVPLVSGTLGFDNDILSVRFDRVRGGIASLVHRPSGRDFVPPGACLGLPEIAMERPYKMNSWIINDLQESFTPVCEALEVVAEGPHLASIVARYRHGDSRIALTWSLGAGAATLQLGVEARWLEHGSSGKGTPRLSLRLPLNITNPVATAEIPFGTLERHEPAGRTMPCLRHVGVGGSNGSMIVANDGLSNYALDKEGLTIHLLRSSYEPDPLPEIGDHAWTLILAPSPDKYAPEAAHRLGVNLNHPLRWTLTDAHPGRLPAASTAVLHAKPDTATVTQVKPAEDGDGIIIRLQELAGKTGEINVHLDPTVWGTLRSVSAVDLLERAIADGQARHSKTTCTVLLSARSILSLRLRLEMANT